MEAQAHDSDDIRLSFTTLSYDDKMDLLKKTKENGQRGNYLTLLTWLDGRPLSGGIPIARIPDEFYWSLSKSKPLRGLFLCYILWYGTLQQQRLEDNDWATEAQ